MRQGYMTGGGVLNVLFAALIGSFSLGLVSDCQQPSCGTEGAGCPCLMPATAAP